MKITKPATKRVANQNKDRKIPRKESTTIMVSKSTRERLARLAGYDVTMDELIGVLIDRFMAEPVVRPLK